MGRPLASARYVLYVAYLLTPWVGAKGRREKLCGIFTRIDLISISGIFWPERFPFLHTWDSGCCWQSRKMTICLENELDEGRRRRRARGNGNFRLDWRNGLVLIGPLSSVSSKNGFEVTRRRMVDFDRTLMGDLTVWISSIHPDYSQKLTPSH